eukprot:1141167-Pelagomonas_calceolata.AAC.1
MPEVTGPCRHCSGHKMGGHKALQQITMCSRPRGGGGTNELSSRGAVHCLIIGPVRHAIACTMLISALSKMIDQHDAGHTDQCPQQDE